MKSDRETFEARRQITRKLPASAAEAAFDPTGPDLGEEPNIGSPVTKTAVFQHVGCGRFGNF